MTCPFSSPIDKETQLSASHLPLVLITHTLPEGWLDFLHGKCNLIIGPENADRLSPKLEENLAAAEGLYCLLTIKVDESLLERAENLKVVSNMAVGVDNIDVAACTRRGIPVGNTPGVLTAGTADLTMAVLLTAARQLSKANQDARQGLWTTWSPTGWLGADLEGATLGLVGLGNIGQAVARRAYGFGMRILYSDPKTQPEFENLYEAKCIPFQDLLVQCDFISLHVPLTPETRGMIGRQELRSMKPSAILVNTSRGAIIDQQALVTALTEGWITAAALDVTEPEPLPPDHPLFSLDNCFISPHIGSATWNTRRRMAERAAENLLAGLDSRPLPYCVNPEVYHSRERNDSQTKS
jgi:glyoxylate reductase